MGLDQSGVLAVGLLVPKEGRHTLLHNTLLVIPPWSSKPPFFVGSPRSLHQGTPLPTHGQQGIHSLGGCKPDERLPGPRWKPWAWDCRAQTGSVQCSVSSGRSKTNGLGPRSDCHGGPTVLSCDAMWGNCDNCSYTHTQDICIRVLTAPVRLGHS